MVSGSGVSRRAVIAGALAGAGLLAFGCSGKDSEEGEETIMPGTLVLKKTGATHDLPANYFGFNTSSSFDVPWEDPGFAAPVRDIAPGHLRFPGGQNANFFDWRSGLMKVPPPYEGIRGPYHQIEPMVNKLHPNGVAYAQFKDFSDKVGAEMLLMVNMNTSSVEEQTAWMESIKATSVPPRLVEMGTEFALAGLGNSADAQRFPNWAVTRDLTKQYVDAFKGYLPPDTKIALQSAGSRFYMPGEAQAKGSALGARMWKWDDDLTNDSWYHAITTHLYPRPGGLGGQEIAPDWPASVGTVYAEVVGRMDAGIDRDVAHLEEKLPGKEIWVTEWSAGSAALSRSKVNYSNGMWLQLIARGMLAFMRHPSVTLLSYHSLMLSDALSSVWVRDAGGYKAVSWAGLLKWFHEAASGAQYSRVTVEGAQRVDVPNSPMGDGFNDVEAALVEKDGVKVAFVHNAAGEEKTVSVASLNGKGPSKVEMMATPDLTESFQQKMPDVTALGASKTLTVPGYSVTRVEW